MRRGVGWLGVLALVVGVVVTLPTAPAVGAQADVHTLTPPPGGVVPAGATPVTAWLRTSADIDEVTVTLDGRPVTPVTIGQSRQPQGTPISARLDLAAGLHTLSVRFAAADGARGERSWQIGASGTSVSRVAGDDRFRTAVALSQRAHPVDALTRDAVLARGDDFADALAGAPLAAHVDGPLLLTTRDVLPDSTRAELRRVLGGGGTVHVLGGSSAVSDEVTESVRGMGFTVRRYAGGTRFETAAAVAAALPATGRAFVVSGTAYADALSASVPAARDTTPILLTGPDEIPAATSAALAAAEVHHATIVGGVGVVSAEVERDLATTIDRVDRVAGRDRTETASLVAAAYFDARDAVGVGSGWGYADALAGAPVLAAEGRPLLLTAPATLPAATVQRVRSDAVDDALVLGGPGAVAAEVVTQIHAASLDDADGPHVVAHDPTPMSASRYLAAVTVAADRSLLATSTMYVTIGGWEVAGPVERADTTVSVRLPEPHGLAPETAHEIAVTTTLLGSDGAVARRSWRATYRPPDPHFGDAGPVALHLPSRNVELIGFHQSNHDGARQVEPRSTSTAVMTLPSRGRGTGLRTAADIVADPTLPVYAPATGTVIRAGTYRLYCDHVDHYLVIEPDAAPGWEVKVLHFEGLAVGKGDRVYAGVTRIGSAPRSLPFESQVDEHSGPDDWPHLHVEVVDPSIPDRPGGGC